MKVVDGLYYTKDHEWARLENDGSIVVGITDFAQDALGSIVYLELPKKGAVLKQGAAFGVVESVKTASDLYSPVSGTVKDTNDGLLSNSEMLNKDPYGDGWLIKLEVDDQSELKGLMDSANYSKHIAEA